MPYESTSKYSYIRASCLGQPRWRFTAETRTKGTIGDRSATGTLRLYCCSVQIMNHEHLSAQQLRIGQGLAVVRELAAREVGAQHKVVRDVLFLGVLAGYIVVHVLDGFRMPEAPL